MNNDSYFLIFGNILKELREERQLSVRGFSKIMDFSAVYISDLENGKRLPTVAVLQRLNERLILTEEQQEQINLAYNTLHPNIPLEVIYYIQKNNLIEVLETLNKYDSTADKVKKLAYDLKRVNNR